MIGPCGACGGISRATSEPAVAGPVGRPDDVDWTVELAGGTDDIFGAVEAGKRAGRPEGRYELGPGRADEKRWHPTADHGDQESFARANGQLSLLIHHFGCDQIIEPVIDLRGTNVVLSWLLYDSADA